MVWLDFDAAQGDALREYAREHGALLSSYGTSCRIVMHRDVSGNDVGVLSGIIKDFFVSPRR